MPSAADVSGMSSTSPKASAYLAVGSERGSDSTMYANGILSPALRRHEAFHPSMLTADPDDDRKKRDSSQAKKKKKKKHPVSANLSGTRYDIVRTIVEKLGFVVAKDEDQNSNLHWNDSFVSTDKVTELKGFQRINHFPGMGEVCRKDCLARNMAKMAKACPEEYSFVPKTWIFPTEYNAFQNYAKDLRKKKKARTFIVKPANGAMGNGISLVRNAEKIAPSDHMIVQEYLDKPFLIDGFKMDLRIYVLVTSCDPLRIFLFHDGLVRLSTEKYVAPHEGNLDTLFMHLTNYSINKHSDTYEKGVSVDTGSKRSIKYLNDYLRKNDYDVAYLWRNISDLIIKTLIVAEPHVLHAYRMCRPGAPPGSDSVCFEILGFDVMLDRKMRPWLLEINRSPSFGTNEKIDHDIKSTLLYDTLKLVNIRASDKKKSLAAQKAASQRRLVQPHKRFDTASAHENEKKRQTVERRKEELRDLLQRVRKDASREDFENKNLGRFRRIFPPEDKFRQEKYAKLLTEAFSTFLSGRAASFHKEIHRNYKEKLKEADVLDMLAQCEADEMEGKAIASRKPRGPPPLSSMPSSRAAQHQDDDVEDEESSDDDDSVDGSSANKTRPQSGASSAYKSPYAQDKITKPVSRPTSSSRPLSASQSRQLSRPTSSSNRLNSVDPKQKALELAAAREEEEELTRRTLLAMADMRIKFPGKTDEEAEWILDRIHENWKFHKPRIASYWLVKLDSIKRRKVIDIVRSNVRAVLQRLWKPTDIESLRLYRIFSRVFNRLLWSHGQGLWNCFSTNGNSWETIFSKSSEVISDSEMKCCRRIVQLCRDCLLIVYQFASEAKAAQQTNPGHMNSGDAFRARDLPGRGPVNWTQSTSVTHRLSNTYSHNS